MRIVIIGGGAAGMMTAATLAESGTEQSIVILEKNTKIGIKVAISGGGRCNVTTGIEEVRPLITKYPRGGKFLQQALYRFGPRQIREWFEDHGIRLKKELDTRVFPCSDRGQDIVDLFIELFKKNGVTVRYSEAVIDIQKKEIGYTVVTKKNSYHADAVVLALGGQAYRHTGSTGDGYALAEKCGHTITPLAPSLNALILQESWAQLLAGVSFTDVCISLPEKSTIFAKGPIVCTHRGISGPAVFAFSSQIAFYQYSKHLPLSIEIDFVPNHSRDEIIQKLRIFLLEHPKKYFGQALHLFLPSSAVEAIGMAHGLPCKTPCAQISAQQMMKSAEILKTCPAKAIGRFAGDEFVTAGGVALSEVNPKTGESLISPGLYFAGEILDVDGYTGGFNLTASWAMGRAVGEAIIACTTNLLK